MKTFLTLVMFMSFFVLGAWLDSEEFPALPMGSAAALVTPMPLAFAR